MSMRGITNLFVNIAGSKISVMKPLDTSHCYQSLLPRLSPSSGAPPSSTPPSSSPGSDPGTLLGNLFHSGSHILAPLSWLPVGTLGSLVQQQFQEAHPSTASPSAPLRTWPHSVQRIPPALSDRHRLFLSNKRSLPGSCLTRPAP